MKMTPLNHWIEKKHGFSPNRPGAMRSWQLEKIREIVEYARSRSRFYAELYGGLKPVESFADFEKYPLISQQNIIDHGTSMLCVPQGEIARIISMDTSGTTGRPKRLYYTASDIALTLDFFEQGMSTLCGSNDRVLILFPASAPEGVGSLLKTALENLGAAVFTAASEPAEIIRRERISVVCGPPDALASTAHLSAGAPVHAVLTSSDRISPKHRRILSDNWGCEIFDHYGSTESGLGGAVECGCHDGMHIRENDLYLETVSPAGEPLPDGEWGQLVLTTLTRSGMPLIRYQTGDFCRIQPEVCRCGSALRRIAGVRRRQDLPEPFFT